jgi:transcription antitermination factor NusG
MTALLNIGDFVEFVSHPAISTPLPAVWYLLRLHPNYDLKAERQLHERGISAYVPKEKKIVKGVWKRKIERIVPIFPGAMFIPDFEADIERLKRFADGIGGFVKYAGEAVKVRPNMMEQIRKFEAHQNRDPEKREFHPGQKVRIVGGPFDLFEGHVERLDPRFRITVLIELLGRAVHTEFEETEVEAVI